MAMGSRRGELQSTIEVMKKVTEETPVATTVFTPAYVDAAFTLWYSRSKPSPARLATMLPDPSEFGIATSAPTRATLARWIKEDFSERAIALDEQVARQMGERLIAEKVRMLESHARIAEEMQQMALEALRNAESIKPGDAIRMLVEGLRVQRESVGIPRTLEKLSDQSDEELFNQIKELLSQSSVELLPAGDEDLDAL